MGEGRKKERKNQRLGEKKKFKIWENPVSYKSGTARGKYLPSSAKLRVCKYGDYGTTGLRAQSVGSSLVRVHSPLNVALTASYNSPAFSWSTKLMRPRLVSYRPTSQFGQAQQLKMTMTNRRCSNHSDTGWNDLSNAGVEISR